MKTIIYKLIVNTLLLGTMVHCTCIYSYNVSAEDIYDSQKNIEANSITSNNHERESSVRMAPQVPPHTNILTTGGIEVMAFLYDEMSDEEIQEQINMQQQYFSDVIELDGPTALYNCHSYAWYNRSVNNNYWINDVDLFIHDPHTITWDPGDPTSTPFNLKVGDIVTYWRDISANSYECKHSAVICGFNSDGSIICRSKWGIGGLYQHDEERVPHNYKLTNGETKVKYHRYIQGQHNTVEVQFNTEKHFIACTKCNYYAYQIHAFRYEQSNLSTHIATCYICGYSQTEGHVPNETGTMCKKCRQPGPLQIAGPNKKDDEIEEAL